MLHGSVYPLDFSLISCSYSSSFLCSCSQMTCMGLKVSCTLFKDLKQTLQLNYKPYKRKLQSFVHGILDHKKCINSWWNGSLSKHISTKYCCTDIFPVGGIRWNSCRNSQQFDRGGGITENIRHFLSHHFLHSTPQVLMKAECAISAHKVELLTNTLYFNCSFCTIKYEC